MSDSQKRKLATHKYTYTHTEVKNNFHLAVAVLLQKYPKMPLEKEQKNTLTEKMRQRERKFFTSLNYS